MLDADLNQMQSDRGDPRLILNILRGFERVHWLMKLHLAASITHTLHIAVEFEDVDYDYVSANAHRHTARRSCTRETDRYWFRLTATAGKLRYRHAEKAS